MLHIIWSIIVGFIIGWLAQALYPGAQHLGFWKAALIGALILLYVCLKFNLVS